MDIENGAAATANEQVTMKVQRHPYKSAARSFANAAKETMFPDDPFRQFKNQRTKMRFLMAIRYLFPIFEWGPKYTFTDLRADLIAGLTIASLSIPQGIAYAKLANLPPIYGLYSTFIPPLIYAILGSSRDLAIGPSAILSLVLGTLLRSEADPVKEPVLHLNLALTATFFAGIFQASLGILRLGFLIDFLSQATIVGFVSGVSVIICLQQLKEILGLKVFTVNSDIISVLGSVFDKPSEWNWRTIIIGIVFVTFCLVTKYIGTKHKKLLWVSAGAPMTSVILTTLFTYVSHANDHGVRIVGHLKEGLNPVSIDRLSFSGPLVMKGIKLGIVIAAIGLMEAIAIGRTFASIKGYHIDGNKEMIAFGVMNSCSACMSCYATTGAVSRSAVNFNAGCRTIFSNIIMAVVIMITLLVLMPLFHYTPNVTLASIIFAAVVGLIDPFTAYHIWKVDKFDFVACIGGFLGVIFISIPMGLLIAVGVSVAMILLHATRPHTSLLGQIPGTSVFRNLKQYPNASKILGILIIRIDASIYFTNANYLRERVFRWVEDEEVKTKERIRFVIIDLTPVMSIDTTGVHAIEEIHRMLRTREIQMVIVNPGGVVVEKLYISKVVEKLGQEWLFVSVNEGVQVCSAVMQLDAKQMSN